MREQIERRLIEWNNRSLEVLFFWDGDDIQIVDIKDNFIPNADEIAEIEKILLGKG